MIAYNYDGRTRRFLGPELADIDPLDPETWLVPANATTERPPDPDGTFWPYWSGTRWELLDEGNQVKAREMRVLRNQALIASDWTQLADCPLDPITKTRWALYRNALRDLPNAPAWPNVSLPVKPCDL